jgi:alpha-1,3-rhamnosyl/mannosyltransferase
MSAHRAARVVTISAFSKQEIVTHLGVDPDKIDVIYPGVPQPSEMPLHRAGVPSVLFVGTVFTRRHVPELIEGFARIAERRSDVRLEIVGHNRTAPRVNLEQLALASGAGDQIHVRSYVTDSDLAALYGSARAFAFLSEYEGFGFTPLEALAAGVPVVVLDTPVAREIYGSAAIFVARPEPALIHAALERALFDEIERARALESARLVLARYSWLESARRTLDALVRCGS